MEQTDFPTRRKRAIAVIRRYGETLAERRLAHAFSSLVLRKGGIHRILTDEALHELALLLIRERRIHNRFAAESRHAYAKQRNSHVAEPFRSIINGIGR